jgi:hypothetical protein
VGSPWMERVDAARAVLPRGRVSRPRLAYRHHRLAIHGPDRLSEGGGQNVSVARVANLPRPQPVDLPGEDGSVAHGLTGSGSRGGSGSRAGSRAGSRSGSGRGSVRSGCSTGMTTMRRDGPGSCMSGAGAASRRAAPVAGAAEGNGEGRFVSGVAVVTLRDHGRWVARDPSRLTARIRHVHRDYRRHQTLRVTGAVRVPRSCGNRVRSSGWDGPERQDARRVPATKLHLPARPRTIRCPSLVSTLLEHGSASRIARCQFVQPRRGRLSRRAPSTGGPRALILAAGAMRICRSFALLAQLVEHFHGKEGVVGSSPTEGFPF